MITYEAVTKIFGTGKDAIVALENVSFDIPPGKVVVFLGAGSANGQVDEIDQ